jgi:hypothetical protein
METKPEVIIEEIFDLAASRPVLTILATPLRELWEAGVWEAQSIVAAVEKVGFSEDETP